jgi:hypothetical protein
MVSVSDRGEDLTGGFYDQGTGYFGDKLITGIFHNWYVR